MLQTLKLRKGAPGIGNKIMKNIYVIEDHKVFIGNKQTSYFFKCSICTISLFFNTYYADKIDISLWFHIKVLIGLVDILI